MTVNFNIINFSINIRQTTREYMREKVKPLKDEFNDIIYTQSEINLEDYKGKRVFIVAGIPMYKGEIIDEYSEGVIKFGNSLFHEPTGTITSLINFFESKKLFNDNIDDFIEIIARTRDKRELINPVEQYYDEITRFINRSIRDKKETIKETKNNIENLFFRIKNYEGEIKRVTVELEALEKCNVETFKDKVMEEYEEIKKMPIVKSLTFEKGFDLTFNNLGITTKVKTGTDVDEDDLVIPIIETKKVIIGDVGIFFDVSELTCYNVNKERCGNPHPHASMDGYMCMSDELRARITNSIRMCEFKKAVSLLYSWATSYNKDDKYVPIERWLD